VEPGVFALAGLLEPGVLVGGVVHHQVDDYLDAAFVGLVHELHEVAAGAVAGVHAVVVGDVVAVVAVGRGLERGQPDGVDADGVQVVELADQPFEVTDAVAVGSP
jgi:hypothetical protein